MAQISTPFVLSDVSHSGLIEFYEQAYELLNKNYNLRNRFENIDRQYQREVDASLEDKRAKAANRTYDPTKFRNVIVPVVLPQVESATSYLSNVFLSGYPIFGVVAPPQHMDAALQLESVIADQQLKGSWIREFIKFFRDGAKYNLHAMECSWEDKILPTLEPGVGVGSANAKKAIWSGNKLKRIDLYNAMWDSRYHPAEVHLRGDFNGYTDMMSRVELKALINSLPLKQVKRLRNAFESSIENTYYIPSINPDTWASESDRKKYGGFNWLGWAGLENVGAKIDYKELYEVTWLNARIIPVEFNMGVPQNKQVQIWRFCIINGKHIIYAERQTNVHNYLPMVMGQPYEDGLGYQTKSLAENVEPFQQVASALMNSNMAAQRRAITDRTLYDPSRIAPKDMASDNPSAQIPVRPAAYGKPIGESVYTFPFRNDQSGQNMQDMAAVMQFANTVGGQNPVRQGQFVKGNKTKVEFEDVMGNATSRDQMTAMMIEDQVMCPLKYMIKSNILQFQGAETLYNQQKQRLVDVDPVALRKAVLDFKISDGLIPNQKLISGDEWMTAMQVIGSTPELKAGFKFVPLVSYLLKTRGADVRQFEKSEQQLAYEQALMAWQQTVQLIIQANTKSETQQPLPPQPLPEQFGYNPGEQNVTTTGNTV